MIALKLAINLPLRIPTITTAILFIVYFIFIFVDKISNRSKDPKSNFKEPISEEEVQEIIFREVNKIKNYVEKGLTKKTHNINKNIIYERRLELLYPHNFGDKQDKIRECIILINATNTKMQPTILANRDNDELLNNSINMLSLDPKEDPNIETTLTENLSTGFRSKIEKKSYNKREEKGEEKTVI